MTACTMFAGMAKPMPMLPPLRERMAVLMPTSSPSQVHQRAAGVAGVDRGVGLDEVLVAVRVDAGAAQRADDARGHRLAEAERVADGHHEVADLEPVGVGERERREVARPSPCSTAMSVPWSVPTTLALSSRSSISVTLISLAFSIDVCVGQDVAVLRVDDDAGARALTRAARGAGRDVEEAAEERVVEQRVLLLPVPLRGDVDHRGRGPLEHRRERRHRRLADGLGCRAAEAVWATATEQRRKQAEARDHRVFLHV